MPKDPCTYVTKAEVASAVGKTVLTSTKVNDFVCGYGTSDTGTVNIGVAAPMAFFPFAGWKNSFFGDLHAHGKDAVGFYTEQKVIMSRWF